MTFSYRFKVRALHGSHRHASHAGTYTQSHREYFACFPLAQYIVLPSEPRQVNIFAKTSQQGDRFNFLLPHPRT